MKILHKDGFTDAERLGYRPVIYDNLLESGHAVAKELADRQDFLSSLLPENRVRYNPLEIYQ